MAGGKAVPSIKTADETTKFVAQQIKVEVGRIRSTLLIPCRRALSELDYIGLKISVPESFYDSLMSSVVGNAME